MRLLILALTAAAAAYAQAPITMTLSGPTTARPGQQITLSLSATDGKAAGLQWQLTLPVGWRTSAATGQALTTANKTLYCNVTTTLCLAVGVNTNVIGAGVIAQNTAMVPSSALPGTYQFQLSGLLGATLDATTIQATSGPVYSVLVLAKTDLNGDGKTDTADLALLVPQITGQSTCTDDQNGDGKCDLLDALILIRAATGL